MTSIRPLSSSNRYTFPQESYLKPADIDGILIAGYGKNVEECNHLLRHHNVSPHIEFVDVNIYQDDWSLCVLKISPPGEPAKHMVYNPGTKAINVMHPQFIDQWMQNVRNHVAPIHPTTKANIEKMVDFLSAKINAKELDVVGYINHSAGAFYQKHLLKQLRGKVDQPLEIPFRLSFNGEGDHSFRTTSDTLYSFNDQRKSWFISEGDHGVTEANFKRFASWKEFHAFCAEKIKQSFCAHNASPLETIASYVDPHSKTSFPISKKIFKTFEKYIARKGDPIPEEVLDQMVRDYFPYDCEQTAIDYYTLPQHAESLAAGVDELEQLLSQTDTENGLNLEVHFPTTEEIAQFKKNADAFLEKCHEYGPRITTFLAQSGIAFLSYREKLTRDQTHLEKKLHAIEIQHAEDLRTTPFYQPNFVEDVLYRNPQSTYAQILMIIAKHTDQLIEDLTEVRDRIEKHKNVDKRYGQVFEQIQESERLAFRKYKRQVRRSSGAWGLTGSILSAAAGVSGLVPGMQFAAILPLIMPAAEMCKLGEVFGANARAKADQRYQRRMNEAETARASAQSGREQNLYALQREMQLEAQLEAQVFSLEDPNKRVNELKKMVQATSLDETKKALKEKRHQLKHLPKPTKPKHINAYNAEVLRLQTEIQSLNQEKHKKKERINELQGLIAFENSHYAMNKQSFEFCKWVESYCIPYNGAEVDTGALSDWVVKSKRIEANQQATVIYRQIGTNMHQGTTGISNHLDRILGVKSTALLDLTMQCFRLGDSMFFVKHTFIPEFTDGYDRWQKGEKFLTAMGGPDVFFNKLVFPLLNGIGVALNLFQMTYHLFRPPVSELQIHQRMLEDLYKRIHNMTAFYQSELHQHLTTIQLENQRSFIELTERLTSNLMILRNSIQESIRELTVKVEDNNYFRVYERLSTMELKPKLAESLNWIRQPFSNGYCLGNDGFQCGVEERELWKNPALFSGCIGHLLGVPGTSNLYQLNQLANTHELSAFSADFGKLRGLWERRSEILVNLVQNYYAYRTQRVAQFENLRRQDRFVTRSVDAYLAEEPRFLSGRNRFAFLGLLGSSINVDRSMVLTRLRLPIANARYFGGGALMVAGIGVSSVLPPVGALMVFAGAAPALTGAFDNMKFVFSAFPTAMNVIDGIKRYTTAEWLSREPYQNKTFKHVKFSLYTNDTFQELFSQMKIACHRNVLFTNVVYIKNSAYSPEIPVPEGFHKCFVVKYVNDSREPTIKVKASYLKPAFASLEYCNQIRNRFPLRSYEEYDTFMGTLVNDYRRFLSAFGSGRGLVPQNNMFKEKLMLENSTLVTSKDASLPPLAFPKILLGYYEKKTSELNCIIRALEIEGKSRFLESTYSFERVGQSYELRINYHLEASHCGYFVLAQFNTEIVDSFKVQTAGDKLRSSTRPQEVDLSSFLLVAMYGGFRQHVNAPNIPGRVGSLYEPETQTLAPYDNSFPGLYQLFCSGPESIHYNCMARDAVYRTNSIQWRYAEGYMNILSSVNLDQGHDLVTDYEREFNAFKAYCYLFSQFEDISFDEWMNRLEIKAPQELVTTHADQLGMVNTRNFAAFLEYMETHPSETWNEFSGKMKLVE